MAVLARERFGRWGIHAQSEGLKAIRANRAQVLIFHTDKLSHIRIVIRHPKSRFCNFPTRQFPITSITDMKSHFFNMQT